MVGRFDERMIVLTDSGFHGTEGDPPNMKVCKPKTWGMRMVVETVLSMLTVVSHFKKVGHRAWANFHARLAYTMAAFNVLAQWNGLRPLVKWLWQNRHIADLPQRSGGAGVTLLEKLGGYSALSA